MTPNNPVYVASVYSNYEGNDGPEYEEKLN